jgi:hypothetical protein
LDSNQGRKHQKLLCYHYTIEHKKPVNSKEQLVKSKLIYKKYHHIQASLTRYKS